MELQKCRMLTERAREHRGNQATLEIRGGLRTCNTEHKMHSLKLLVLEKFIPMLMPITSIQNKDRSPE